MSKQSQPRTSFASKVRTTLVTRNARQLVETAAPSAGASAGEALSPPTAPPRTKLTVLESRKVWVRAGGLCTLCQRYLLEGALTGLEEVSLGELAHVVGQQDTARSPRGQHPMPRAERDLAENIILACESCHEEIDDQRALGILDVDALRALKARHEQRIRHVTTLPDDRRSLVLRMVAELRGGPTEVSRDSAAAAVIGTDRFPWFDLDRDRLGAEINLRTLPGEPEAKDSYYAAARNLIDRVLEHKLEDAVRSGDVKHVSVFAFARLPLLVYLGYKLGDNYAVEAFQRHRSTDSWSCPHAEAGSRFDVVSCGALDDATQVVLVLNVSGTVSPDQIPEDLRRLPTITVTPDVLPSPDVITSRAALAGFTTAARSVNALFDAHKNLRTAHLFGAIPPAAAIELGRLHDAHIHPALVVYDRTSDGSYRRTEEIA